METKVDTKNAAPSTDPSGVPLCGLRWLLACFFSVARQTNPASRSEPSSLRTIGSTAAAAAATAARRAAEVAAATIRFPSNLEGGVIEEPTFTSEQMATSFHTRRQAGVEDIYSSAPCNP